MNILENPNKNTDFLILCPLTKIEYNGLNKFYFLWSCGCVFSEKIISEIKDKEKKCVTCGTEYNDSDLISLNMNPED